MIERILSEINPTYSERFINHIILSLSIIVGGALLLDYIVKRMKNDLKINYGRKDIVLSRFQLKKLIIFLIGVLCTFLSLELIDSVLVETNYYYLRIFFIIVSFMSFGYVWKKSR